MPYNEYCTVDELAPYGAIFSSRSPVGNSTMFDNLLQRVSENRFKSIYRKEKNYILVFQFLISCSRYLRIAKYFGKR